MRGVSSCASCGEEVPTSRWRKLLGVLIVAAVPVGMLVLIFGRCLAADTATGKIELTSERLGSFAFEADICRRRDAKQRHFVIGSREQAGRELHIWPGKALLRVQLPEGGWRELSLSRRSCRYFSLVIDSVKHGKRESTRAYHGRVYLTCELDEKTRVSTAVHFSGC